ncbi:CpaD family pilus assembly protein [Parvularcula sp. LCG005]|uniref:CpaD family pilus assembly protein n=1 Tax=Parvularcula sp. LCG005 TaxID=3078805 RepID=UPI002942D350|nr:CpaD family pilus assembly protein [Parvularcula sp. LCG005]WOI53564.1 CpaD family pilus assembly protein [Parvularcula sp. LCG005]
MIRTFILASVVTLAASGCSHVMNGQNEALSVAERHPITVDQQTVTVAIPVDSTRNGLSRQALADLDNFMTAYRTRGHGPVTVTAPSGTSRNIDAQQVASDVRQALNSFGLDYGAMQGATYRTGDTPSAVLVSFTQYVATGPVCGAFDGGVTTRFRNLAPTNFGCADQHNLAAMVADPRDLTQMQPMGPSIGTAGAAASRAPHTGAGTWQREGSYGASVGGDASGQ